MRRRIKIQHYLYSLTMHNIADIRKDYRLQTLNEADVHLNPLSQFNLWWEQAINAEIEEVNAMTLATVDESGNPNARVVLLKGIDESGFVFFTNYDSCKAREIEHSQNVCLVFFWKELERQVRIRGKIDKLDATDNDSYFFSRPFGSQIGAWASPQSQVIPDRSILEKNVQALELKFSKEEMERPTHWGGYRVVPVEIEFWQGRSNRLHDRIRYRRVDSVDWLMERLAP
jgi:pyridoxamine 5'-phosphate oxidase